jgi:hypothetical protein
VAKTEVPAAEEMPFKNFKLVKYQQKDLTTNPEKLAQAKDDIPYD